jgi:hypothetical protein
VTLTTKHRIPTNIHLFKGAPHGFRRYGDKLSVSKAWDEVMEQGILWAIANPEPLRKFDVIVHS